MIDSPPAAPRKLEKLVAAVTTRLRGQGGFIMASLATAVGGVGAIAGFEFAVLASAILVILGIVLQILLKPTYAELERTVSDERETARETAHALQSSLESQLRQLAVYCEINQTHQRMTLYCHVGAEFVMLARESSNMELRKRGRGIYPADRGVIGEAWNVGESLRSRWPEQRSDWDEFQCKEYGLPREQVRLLSMHARSMVAMRLGEGSNMVGVLVMESTEALGVKKAHLNKARDSMLLRSICEVLVAWQYHFPAVAEYRKMQAAASEPVPHVGDRRGAHRAPRR